MFDSMQCCVVSVGTSTLSKLAPKLKFNSSIATFCLPSGGSAYWDQYAQSGLRTLVFFWCRFLLQVVEEGMKEAPRTITGQPTDGCGVDLSL